MFTKFINLISLLRPKQWIKNGFVLAPLLFSGTFLNTENIVQALVATILFCIASSATYIVNDIHDIDHDRKHPLKSRKRPLASGAVSITEAYFLLVLLLGLLVFAYFLVASVMSVIVAYLLLNGSYTLILKHQPVLDIFTIAIGFVLRVYTGTVALSLVPSSWMLVTTLCLALYLAAIKRRQELLLSGTEGRKVLAHYSVALVERYAEMAATGALVFYSLFVMTVRPELIMTIPIVIFGLFRYWFVVESLDGGESPTDALLSDWQLILAVLFWIGSTMWAIWPSV